MSTITAILKPDADGTLHLPLPAEFREGEVKVTATIERVPEDGGRAAREAAVAALKRLRERGTFRGVDSVAWQREIRRDRPLRGRAE